MDFMLDSSKLISMKPPRLYEPVFAKENKRFDLLIWSKDKWSIKEFIENDKISFLDKMSMLLKTEFFKENELHKFACDCISWMINKMKIEDDCVLSALEIKRKWISDRSVESERLRIKNIIFDKIHTIGNIHYMNAYFAVLNCLELDANYVAYITCEYLFKAMMFHAKEYQIRDFVKGLIYEMMNEIH